MGALSGQTVLEIGAGAGLSALSAARLGAAVCATDLPRALGLLRHNAQRNGGVGGGEQQRFVCCPGGHALEPKTAEHEDYICNVCGLDDPLGGGIEEVSAQWKRTDLKEARRQTRRRA